MEGNLNAADMLVRVQPRVQRQVEKDAVRDCDADGCAETPLSSKVSLWRGTLASVLDERRPAMPELDEHNESTTRSEMFVRINCKHFFAAV